MNTSVRATPHPQPHRRRLLALLAAPWAIGAGLAGCASSARRELTASQVERLRSAGFTPSSDGGWEYLLSGRILFETDADSLDDESLRIVARLAPLLASLGVSPLRVEGHTDSVGSEAHNRGLSLRRAQSVARALRERGVSAEVVVVGLGKDRPIADNATPDGRAQNRRVAIIVPGP